MIFGLRALFTGDNLESQLAKLEAARKRCGLARDRLAAATAGAIASIEAVEIETSEGVDHERRHGERRKRIA